MFVHGVDGRGIITKQITFGHCDNENISCAAFRVGDGLFV